jgi:hypothetical protein
MQRRLIATAVLTLAATCAVSSLPAHAAPRAVQAAVTTQLPRTAVPRHYEVTLTPDAQAGTFAGKVMITLDVVQGTRTITLNAADLAFTRAAITQGGGAALAATTSVDDAAQTATFTFARTLAPGRLYGGHRHAGRGPVLARLSNEGRQAARAVHAVRKLRRAPHDPVVGRTLLQGHVHTRGHRAGCPDGRQ